MNAGKCYFFKTLLLATATVIVSFADVNTAIAQETNVYRMQSLFLYNFTKHVKWENAEGSTFTIGILGGEEAYNEIKSSLENKQAWGNNIRVVRMNNPADMKNCHIAYFTKASKKRVLEFIGSGNPNTLVVTEEDMVNEGAAISFIFDQSKMNFKINKAKIEQSGLKVSSQLLSIGVQV